MKVFESLPPTRGQLRLGCAAFALLGAAAMAFLNAPILTEGGVYNYDLTQSPHWVAYHGDSFAEDDLLVEYSTYNESPVQNALYWIGTLWLDLVLLNKLVGIAIFGATAALFFYLGSLMMGARAGALAALFFIVFPRSAYEISGGFSKAWAIGFVLVAVYVVETRRWSILLWTMPLAALAYPVSPVLMGGIVAVGLALEFRSSPTEAIGGLKRLASASALALVPLLSKYYLVSRPRIGEMISPQVMRQIWDAGINTSYTQGFWREVLDYLEYPFFVYGTLALLILSRSLGLVWRRSWTALVVASVVLYYVSDLVVPKLYLPDRYSRFSIAVLIVLWNAANWSRVLEYLKNPWTHRAAVAVLMGLTVLALPGVFEPGDGGETLSRWRDRRHLTAVSRAVASQPEPVLVAGHPYHLGDILVQAGRPVTVVHRMSHRWYIAYSEAIQARIRDTFRATYARDVADVNRLVDEYSVTHLLLNKSDFRPSRLRRGRIYGRHLREFIGELTRNTRGFLLNPPPAESIVFEDDSFWLVRLPLDPAGSGNIPGSQVP